MFQPFNVFIGSPRCHINGNNAMTFDANNVVANKALVI